MKKLSVIIPCFNVEKCLSKCLSSLENQTMDHNLFEVIFIDDCSEDGTLHILHEYKDKVDFRILVIENRFNLGPGLSRYEGVKQALGEYVCFCDSDDWYDFSFLEQVYEKINAEHSDVVITDMNYVFNNKTVYKDLTSNMDFSDAQSFIAFAGESLCNLAVKTSIFLSIDVVDVRNGEDLALVPLIMMKSGVKSILSKPLYNYYIRENSASVSYSKEAYKNMLKAYHHIFNNLSLEERKTYQNCIEFLGVKIVLYNATLMALKMGNHPSDLKMEYLNDFNAVYSSWDQNPYISSLSLFKRMYLYCLKHEHWLFVKGLVKIHSMILG